MTRLEKKKIPTHYPSNPIGGIFFFFVMKPRERDHLGVFFCKLAKGPLNLQGPSEEDKMFRWNVTNDASHIGQFLEPLVKTRPTGDGRFHCGNRTYIMWLAESAHGGFVYPGPVGLTSPHMMWKGDKGIGKVSFGPTKSGVFCFLFFFWDDVVLGYKAYGWWGPRAGSRTSWSGWPKKETLISPEEDKTVWWIFFSITKGWEAQAFLSF